MLILTLWTLFFLGALALAVGGHVSADLRLAAGVREGAMATALARAGAERAAMAVLRNPTNWNGMVEGDLGSDETVFRDNDSLAGGTFSVYYEYVQQETGLVATNFGVVREARKININKRRDNAREQLLSLGVPPGVIEHIFLWPARKTERLEDEGGPGLFESLHELLLVEGVTGELYARLAPHVTLYSGETFGGVAQGVVRREGGGPVATRRVAFVFDRRQARFVHWYEF